MKNLLQKQSIQASLISLFVLMLSACSNSTQEPVTPEQKQAAITVITQPSTATYFDSESGADGFEFRLIQGFAEQNGYKLNIVIAKDNADIYKALDHGLADIAMIGQPLSFSHQDKYPSTQGIMDVTTQLIYRHSTGKPHSFEDLNGKHIVVRDCPQYREKYKFLKAHYPELNWEFSNLSSEELLGYVNTGKVDYTLLESHEYLSKRSLYTKTRIAFDLYYPEPISWAFSKHSDTSMRYAIDMYLDQAHENGTIAGLTERFYGHAENVNPRGSMTFFKRVHTRLPHYQDLVEAIAEEYGMDWRLLAAVSYQESHWNPRAKSPTGVRGMMMLTQTTAKEMGIKNRLDVEQSLRGGAKYLSNLKSRLPKAIQEPDRTWFALAAYNVGMGHLYDARKITNFTGDNPNKWADVQKHLPKLESEKWNQFTRYGFARGSEPVSYVQHIRQYNDLLEWRFPMEETGNVQQEAQLSIKELDKATIKQAQAEADKEDDKLGQADDNIEGASAAFFALFDTERTAVAF